MSTNAKTIIAVLVVLLVAALGYYWFASTPVPMPGEGTMPPQTVGNSAENTSLPSGSSTSDSALTADLQAIDSQMGGFKGDSAAVNEGVNAQASDSVQ